MDFRRFFILAIWLIAAVTMAFGAPASTGFIADEEEENEEEIISIFELDEVIIRGKLRSSGLGHNDRLKNNPALDIIKELISQRNDYRPATNGTQSRWRRDVTGIALDNPTTGILKYALATRPELYVKYLDTTSSGMPILYLSCHEKYYNELFDEDGNSIRPTAIYQLDKSSMETALTRLETALSVQHSAEEGGPTAITRRTGIDDFLTEDEIEGPLSHYIGNTDIFSGDICMLDNRFPSPISPYGTIVYRYAMGDTLSIGGHRCIDIVFAPVDPYSVSFMGHILVDAESHMLRCIRMTTAPHMKLNFVKSVSMAQDFDQTEEGRIDMTHETVICRLAITALRLERLGSVALRRDVDYKPGQSEDIPTPSYPYTLTKGLVGELRHRPGYRLLEGIGGMAYTTYFPSDPLEPKYWLGPVMSLFSWNSVEGVRIRPGIVTSAYLNPHWAGRGYVAYGTRDHRWKYMAEAEYSLTKKEKYFSEYPMRSIRLHSDYDILPLGLRQPGDSWDNLIESIKHPYHYPYAMQSRQELAFADEYRSGLSWEAVLRRRAISDPSGTYQPEFFPHGGVRQTEMELNLRFAPGEVYKLEIDDRHLVSKETPIFTLSHTMAYGGFMGSDYDYQRTMFTYRQRIRFHGLGFMDQSIKAGRVWTSDVPVPLLIVPPTTPSTYGSQGLFSDIDPMELVSDRYVSWDFTSRTKGILFNHIPLIRRLGLREVVGARMLWLDQGKLPTTMDDGTLIANPNVWQPIPYTKFIVGVSNIFSVLEVDYIRRLTYRDVFITDSDGLQVRLKLKF